MFENNLYKTVDEDTYAGIITRTETKIMEGNIPQYIWTIRIEGGKEDGTEIFKMYTLKSNVAVDFMKKELKLIGMEKLASREKYEECSGELVGLKIVFQACVNEYGTSSFYIKKRYDEQKDMAKTQGPSNW